MWIGLPCCCLQAQPVWKWSLCLEMNFWNKLCPLFHVFFLPAVVPLNQGWVVSTENFRLCSSTQKQCVVGSEAQRAHIWIPSFSRCWHLGVLSAHLCLLPNLTLSHPTPSLLLILWFSPFIHLLVFSVPTSFLNLLEFLVFFFVFVCVCGSVLWVFVFIYLFYFGGNKKISRDNHNNSQTGILMSARCKA